MIPIFTKKKIHHQFRHLGRAFENNLGPEFEFEHTNLQKESSKQEFEHTNLQKFKSTRGFLDVEASD